MVIVNRILTVIFVLLLIAFGAIWGLSYVKVQGAVYNYLSQPQISDTMKYGSIRISGSPFGYNVILSDVKVNSMFVNLDVPEYLIKIKSSSFLSFDKMELSAPQGLEINAMENVVSIEGAEIKAGLNKNRDMITSLYIDLGDVSIEGFEEGPKFLINMTKTSIPLNKESVTKLMSMANRDIRLNKLEASFQGVYLYMDALLKVRNEEVSSGWGSLEIKGYEPKLDMLTDMDVLSASDAYTIKKVIDCFDTKGFGADKQINIKIDYVDGDILINGETSGDFSAKVMERAPELSEMAEELMMPLMMMQMYMQEGMMMGEDSGMMTMSTNNDFGDSSMSSDGWIQVDENTFVHPPSEKSDADRVEEASDDIQDAISDVVSGKTADQVSKMSIKDLLSSEWNGMKEVPSLNGYEWQVSISKPGIATDKIYDVKIFIDKRAISDGLCDDLKDRFFVPKCHNGELYFKYKQETL